RRRHTREPSRNATTGCAGSRRSYSDSAKTRCHSNAQSEGHLAMNNKARLELMEVIAELCERYPDWRLGQLVENLSGWADQEVWDVEDEQLLHAARLHLQQLTPKCPTCQARKNNQSK